MCYVVMKGYTVLVVDGVNKKALSVGDQVL